MGTPCCSQQRVNKTLLVFLVDLKLVVHLRMLLILQARIHGPIACARVRVPCVCVHSLPPTHPPALPPSLPLPRLPPSLRPSVPPSLPPSCAHARAHWAVHAYQVHWGAASERLSFFFL
jgi:hypothetical protein